MGGILRLPSFITTYPLPPEDSTTINRLSHRSTSPSNCLDTSMAKDVFLQHASNRIDGSNIDTGKEDFQNLQKLLFQFWYSTCNCWFFKMILEIDMFLCHVGVMSVKSYPVPLSHAGFCANLASTGFLQEEVSAVEHHVHPALAWRGNFCCPWTKIL